MVFRSMKYCLVAVLSLFLLLFAPNLQAQENHEADAHENAGEKKKRF